MAYERLTIPNLTPARCKETNYTQQEELVVLRQRLYQLENAIDEGQLIEVPSSRICYLTLEENQPAIECCQDIFYNQEGCLEVKYALKEEADNALQ